MTDRNAERNSDTNSDDDTDDTQPDAEPTAFVGTEIPKTDRDAVKAKRGHGGISEVIRTAMQEEAYGEELGQRARLEARRDEIREKRDEKRDELREVTGQLESEIEEYTDELETINQQLNGLTTRDERYDAKLEALEYSIRVEGKHLFPGYGQVTTLAAEVGKEPEGVIEDLRRRNPDVPDDAFREVMHADRYNPPDRPTSAPVGKDLQDTDVTITPLGDRDERYRKRSAEAEAGAETEGGDTN